MAHAARVRSVRAMVQIRLTKKFANMLDGIDLTVMRVGEVVSVPVRVAQILVAEGWAVAHPIWKQHRATHPSSSLSARGDFTHRSES